MLKGPTYKKHRPFRLTVQGIEVQGGDVDEAHVGFNINGEDMIVLAEFPCLAALVYSQLLTWLDESIGVHT